MDLNSSHLSLCLSTSICVSTYVPTYVCMHLPMNASTYECIYLRMHLPMYVTTYVCIYLCMYLPLYVPTYVCGSLQFSLLWKLLRIPRTVIAHVHLLWYSLFLSIPFQYVSSFCWNTNNLRSKRQYLKQLTQLLSDEICFQKMSSTYFLLFSLRSKFMLKLALRYVGAVMGSSFNFQWKGD